MLVFRKNFVIFHTSCGCIIKVVHFVSRCRGLVYAFCSMLLMVFNTVYFPVWLFDVCSLFSRKFMLDSNVHMGKRNPGILKNLILSVFAMYCMIQKVHGVM
jgi:hypothetical protein